MRTIIHALVLTLALPLALSAQITVNHLTPSTLGVVNAVPADQSPETDENVDPGLAISTGGPYTKLVVHTITPNKWIVAGSGGPSPYFSSEDSGVHWYTNGGFVGGGSSLDWNPARDAYAAVRSGSPYSGPLKVFHSADPTGSFNDFTEINAGSSLGLDWR